MTERGRQPGQLDTNTPTHHTNTRKQHTRMGWGPHGRNKMDFWPRGRSSFSFPCSLAKQKIQVLFAFFPVLECQPLFSLSLVPRDFFSCFILFLFLLTALALIQLVFGGGYLLFYLAFFFLRIPVTTHVQRCYEEAVTRSCVFCFVVLLYPFVPLLDFC